MCHAVDADVHPFKPTIDGRIRLGQESWLHAVSLRITTGRLVAALEAQASAAAVFQGAVSNRNPSSSASQWSKPAVVASDIDASAGCRRFAVFQEGGACPPGRAWPVEWSVMPRTAADVIQLARAGKVRGDSDAGSFRQQGPLTVSKVQFEVFERARPCSSLSPTKCALELSTADGKTKEMRKRLV